MLTSAVRPQLRVDASNAQPRVMSSGARTGAATLRVGPCRNPAALVGRPGWDGSGHSRPSEAAARGAAPRNVSTHWPVPARYPVCHSHELPVEWRVCRSGARPEYWPMSGCRDGGGRTHGCYRSSQRLLCMSDIAVPVGRRGDRAVEPERSSVRCYPRRGGRTCGVEDRNSAGSSGLSLQRRCVHVLVPELLAPAVGWLWAMWRVVVARLACVMP